MMPWPVWLFDSPLLRRALAQVNLPAVAAIVRGACGLSQRDLAGVIGWSPAALSYYERGARDGLFDIRTALQFADAVGMPRVALLPLVFADPDAGQASGNGTGTDCRRHDSDGLSAATGVSAVLSRASALCPASSSHLRYWRACTDVLHARGRAVGGTVLLAAALQQRQHVRLTAGQNPAGDAARPLLSVAGEAALCTGWIALDAGQLPLARSLYEQAAKLADGAGDAVLAVHLLTSRSMLLAEIARTGPTRDRARQALRLAFQAQEEGRYLAMPQLHALIALRHASAAALLGDKTAFEAAITQARRELDRGPRDDGRPQWLRSVDEAEITGVEANGYLSLGDASRSAHLYRQVLATGLSPRSRAVYGAGLAAALLTQGTPGEAVAAAMEVLPALEAGIISSRCLDQLHLVRQAAGTSSGAPEFRERFDVINRGLAGSCGLPGHNTPQATGTIPVLPHQAEAPVGISR
jgi:hypothetical protein